MVARSASEISSTCEEPEFRPSTIFWLTSSPVTLKPALLAARESGRPTYPCPITTRSFTWITPNHSHHETYFASWQCFTNKARPVHTRTREPGRTHQSLSC